MTLLTVVQTFIDELKDMKLHNALRVTRHTCPKNGSRRFRRRCFVAAVSLSRRFAAGIFRRRKTVVQRPTPPQKKKTS